MGKDRQGKGHDIEDEDALVTMVDHPALSFLDDEDDSDLASTQLEWVSPLDSRFGDGKPVDPPERFPADEPLTPPRRLAPEFAAPKKLPEETDPTLPKPPEAEQTSLRPVAPGEPLDLVESREDLDASDLQPDDPEPAPRAPAPRAPSGARSGSRSHPSGGRPAVPSLERRTYFDPPRRDRKRTRTSSGSTKRPTPPPTPDPMRALRLMVIGLVVSLAGALLVLSVAAAWWYTMG